MKNFKFDMQLFTETINGTAGNDNLTISRGANDIIAYGYEGNDVIEIYIYGSNNNVTLVGGAGNDTLFRDNHDSGKANNVLVIGGEGNDSLFNGSNDNWTISGDEGNDIIYSRRGNNISINGGSGDDNITNQSGASATIYGGEGIDSISSSGSNAIISGDNGNDSITNNGNYCLIEGGNDNDYIYSSAGINVTINGGDGNDALYASGNQNGFINGDSGDDSIKVLKSSDNATIIGGAGDDQISIDSSAVFIQYSYGDGEDTIYGFNENDTLQIIDTTYSTVRNDNNLMVYVAGGSILLAESAGVSVNIDGIEYQTTQTDTSTNTTQTDTTTEIIDIDDVTVINTGSSAVKNVSIDSYVNVRIELEDRDILVKYGVGETVQFKNNFIQGDSINVRFAKWLEISQDANFYWGVGENAEVSLADFTGSAINVSLNNSNFNDTSNIAFYGDIKTIDARGYTGYALLSGKDNVDNVIYGNETSCAMWGGNGGNDTLIGGNGSDLFWYVNGGGTDIVRNANSNDTVRFDGITLDELVGGGGQIIGNDVKVELKNGGSLTVENARNTEVVFDFNDTKYAVNSSTGEWEFR